MISAVAAAELAPRLDGQLVGRVRERRLLDGLIESVEGGGTAALIVGQTGVGKTALLMHVAGLASGRGLRVLSARGEESEAGLAFATVADLLRPLRRELAELPGPQRQALEVCLALSAGPAPGPLAACAGALEVLARAADEQPLAVLVDDFQWVDAQSRRILLFAARRLAAQRIVMVFAVRDQPGKPPPGWGLPALRIGGLSVAECAELARGLGAGISGPALRSLVELTGGNPLAVLAAAVTGPDAAAAEALAAAAADARQRGGYGASARTWRRAAELTADHRMRATRLLRAAADAYLAGDPGMAAAWCEEALAQCHSPVLVAEAELILGRARTWAGDPLPAFDGLVRAAAVIRPASPAWAAALLAEATVPAAMTGHAQLVRQVTQQVEELWDDTGSAAAGAGASLTVLAMVAGAFVRAGELDHAARYRDRAQALLPSDLGAELQGAALLAQGDTWTERFEPGRLGLGAVIDRGRRLGAPAIVSLALGLSGELGWWTGRWASAYADATEALRWAQEMNQVGLIGHALSRLSRIAAARGDRERCEEHVQRARRDVEPHGVGCLAVHNAATLGLCALSRGDLAAAIDHLERAWDAAQAAGLGNPNVVPFAGDLAEALARAGATERAGQVLAWLQNRAEVTGLVYPRAAAARARGILACDPAEAGAWFARARSAYQLQPMPFELARTLLCEGEALRRARRPGASRRPLQHALTIFTGLGARPWAARAMTELAATGARNDVSTSAVDCLSPQELQVARAVGRGLNNIETAAALFVSRKTVEAHLTRAYRKLGIRSRTELTRLMVTCDETR